MADGGGAGIGTVADGVTVDKDRALASLDRCTAAACALLRQIEDPRPTAVGYWSVGETAAHLSHAFQAETDMLGRDTSIRLDSLDRLGDFNQARLREDPERDPVVIAARLESLLTQFNDKAASAQDPFTWHAGITLPVATAAALVVSELLVHGHDIATAAGKPWVVPTEDAVVVFEGLLPLLPHYVDRASSAGFRAVYEVAMRGGSKVLWSFDEATLNIESPDGRPVDCRISADPGSYLLVAWGRISQWKPILTGKLVAYGRKPWLGMKLPSLMANP